jgi:hypothetical protein
MDIILWEIRSNVISAATILAKFFVPNARK